MTRYGWLLNLVMGLALLVGGAWLLVYELQHPPAHSGHVYVMVGIALLGALLINPTPIISSVKSVVVVVLPLIPWSKVAAAKRASAGVARVDDSEPNARTDDERG